MSDSKRLFAYGILAEENDPEATLDGYEIVENAVYGRFRSIRPKEGSSVKGRLRTFSEAFDSVEGPGYLRTTVTTTEGEEVWVYIKHPNWHY